MHNGDKNTVTAVFVAALMFCSVMVGGVTFAGTAAADVGVSDRAEVPLQVDASVTNLPGDGTEANPYEISNVSELQTIESDLDANYTLVSDINASNTAEWNNGSGFDPIGENPYNNETAPAFTGSLDGNNHTITDLVIDRPSKNSTGVFGGNDGSVSNVRLVNATVTGNRLVGGLVGINNHILDNVTVSGNVTASESVVGGLTGSNFGTIQNAASSATVRGPNSVGGLAAYNNGTVTAGASSSTVNASGSDVGGLIGFNDGRITNASASGSVSSSEFDAGGLVGENNRGVIINATASTTVNGSSSVGGLVGENYAGTVVNSTASGAITGSRFVGGVVGYNNEANAVISNSTATGSISGESTVGGLVGGNYDNATIRDSTAVLDVTGSFRIGGAVGTNSGRVRDVAASGDAVGTDTVGGVVGRAFAGTITNVSASGNVSADEFVGGVVGSTSVSITNTTASGNVTGSDIVGGIAGENSRRIINATALGDVTGSDNVGGVVGLNDGTIRDVDASGNVTGSTKVAGIVGTNEGITANASSSGIVTGNNTVGGAVGFNDYGLVANVTASPTINNSEDVGSLIGDNDGSLRQQFSVEAGTTDNIDIEYNPNSAGGSSSGDKHAEDLHVATVNETGFTFGGNTDRALRVVEPRTGESVTVAPRTSVGFESAIEFDIQPYGPDGSIEQPSRYGIRVESENYGVTTEAVVTGNKSLFKPTGSPPNPFEEYKVQLLDGDGTVVSETAPEPHGIGYNATLSQNSTTGQVQVSIPRNPAVNDSWHVQYTVRTDGSTEDIVKSVENDPTSEQFSVTIDAGKLPKGNYTHSFEIAKSNTSLGADRIIVIFAVDDLRIDSEVQTVLTVDADGAAGNYTAIEPAVNNASAGDRIEVEPGTYRELVTVDKNVTLVAPSGATLAAPTTVPSDSHSLSVTTGTAPTIRGFGFNGTSFGNDSAAIKINGSATPVIENITIHPLSSTATGSYRAGIDARETTGAWEVQNSMVHGAGHASLTGVSAASSSGNWLITGTQLTNTSQGVDAHATSGDWQIQTSTIADTNGNGIVAASTTGAWSIRETTLINSTASGLSADDAELRGDATYNYWGTADGPSGAFNGSGDAVTGNVTVTPYYSDAARTALTTPVNSSGQATVTFTDGAVKATSVTLPVGSNATRVTVTPSEIPTDEAPEPKQNATAYLDISADQPVTNNTTITVTLQQSALQGVDDPTLLHYVNGSWESLNTTVNATTLTGTSDGLSPFAVAESATDDDAGNGDGTDDGTGDGTDADDGDSTDDGGSTELAQFNISTLDPQNVTVTAGDTFRVNATVRNIGNATGTQTVAFRVNESEAANQTVTLDAGKTTTVTFADLNTTELAAGTYAYSVITDHAEETGTLTVTEKEGIVADPVDDETSDSTPGFGVFAALMVLLSAVMFLRHRG